MKNYENLSNEDFLKIKKLAYENSQKELTNVGFLFKNIWITDPFFEMTGRFEFKDLKGMIEYYGEDNIKSYLNKIEESKSKEEKDPEGFICLYCDYCNFPKRPDDNDGLCTCRSMKNRTIEVYVCGGGSPEWCPFKNKE